jgi:hypothetical protein
VFSIRPPLVIKRSLSAVTAVIQNYHHPDAGDSTILWNFGIFLRDYMRSIPEGCHLNKKLAIRKCWYFIQTILIKTRGTITSRPVQQDCNMTPAIYVPYTVICLGPTSAAVEEPLYRQKLVSLPASQSYDAVCQEPHPSGQHAADDAHETMLTELGRWHQALSLHIFSSLFNNAFQLFMPMLCSVWWCDEPWMIDSKLYGRQTSWNMLRYCGVCLQKLRLTTKSLILRAEIRARDLHAWKRTVAFGVLNHGCSSLSQPPAIWNTWHVNAGYGI